jgi:PAS domain S-box-containing protein
MARLDLPPPNFADCLTIGEAAEFLGVSTATLRNWDRTGKLKPRRHPQNGYRIYLHEDLELVLRSADLSTLTDESFAPQVDWTKMRDSEHFVQFYENDAYLVESVSGFVGIALREGDCSVVIATPEHRHALQRKLIACGVEVTEAEKSGRFVSLDAAETLSRFMVGREPHPRRFDETVGRVIEQMAERGSHCHAFGEMVALLWAEGNRNGAIALEQLWNNLLKHHRFALFCAYPISGFAQDAHTDDFQGICSCHSRVIPAESYTAAATADKRLRAISLLQQKAQSLEAEIEHRKEVESLLAAREAELADFFENALEGLHKVDADGTILWANKAEYSLLGYSEAEFIGHSIAEFHADQPVIEDMLKRLQNGESLVNFPARLRCKNGAIKHVFVSSNAFFDDGKLLYTRFFTRDITEQWHAEKALLDADRRKDEFLATLSHELRNPLAPIRNSLALLDADCDRVTQKEACGVIHRQVEHMKRLVDDLLDISRVTRDKIELRKEMVELGSIIKAAVETSRPFIDSARQHLDIAVPADPIHLHADPARLSQVFSNLLNNASKFTEPGGRIEIRLAQHGREAVISVRDNGIGIPCEELDHVFDMFRQADQSLEKSRDGLGIGLTLVRRFVELHGGAVNVQSEGPGKGSEFTVRLPIADAVRPKQEIPKAAQDRPIANYRILVVDDNRDSRYTLCMLLRVKGHDVREARDGLEAIAVAEEFRPEVILMDVGMPKLNGYEATRRLREADFGKDAMIVALTGWGQTSDVAQSIEAGCSAHLVKPVDFVELDRLLSTVKKSA